MLFTDEFSGRQRDWGGGGAPKTSALSRVETHLLFKKLLWAFLFLK